MPLSRRLMPSITELVAFEAAARHGSFTRAAEELALTQGAVSKQVRQLEDSLGVALFEREQRRVILTDAGRNYLTDVRDLLDRLEQSTHAVLATGGGAVVNLAVLPTFASRWLIPRLHRFTPDITVNLTTRLEPFDFEREPFDLAIHYGTGNWPAARAYHLLDEEMVAVASPAYRAAKQLERPEDLTRVALLQQATRPNLWLDWFAACGIEVATPYRGAMLDQFSMTAEAAANGLGVGLVPRFLIEGELASGRLVVLFDRPLRQDRTYFVVTPTGRRRNPAVAAFLDWLRDEAAAYAAGRATTGT